MSVLWLGEQPRVSLVADQGAGYPVNAQNNWAGTRHIVEDLVRIYRSKDSVPLEYRETDIRRVDVIGHRFFLPRSEKPKIVEPAACRLGLERGPLRPVADRDEENISPRSQRLGHIEELAQCVGTAMCSGVEGY